MKLLLLSYFWDGYKDILSMNLFIHQMVYSTHIDFLLSMKYAHWLTFRFTTDEMATSNNYEISTWTHIQLVKKNFLENIFLKLEYVLKFIAWKCKLRLLSYPFQRHVFFLYIIIFPLKCMDEKICYRRKSAHY